MSKDYINQNFDVPKGYFEHQQIQLMDNKNNSFQVPDHYFEAQQEQLLQSVYKTKKKPLNYYKLISIAAIFAFVFGMLMYWLTTEPVKAESNEMAVASVISELYLEPEPATSLDDVDLLNEYFGKVEDYTTFSPKTEPDSEPLLKDQETNNLPNIKTSTIEDKEIGETLYELYLDEKTPSEEEVLEEDYLLL